jgi:hypothetical protein
MMPEVRSVPTPRTNMRRETKHECFDLKLQAKRKTNNCSLALLLQGFICAHFG